MSLYVPYMSLYNLESACSMQCRAGGCQKYVGACATPGTSAALWSGVAGGRHPRSSAGALGPGLSASVTSSDTSSDTSSKDTSSDTSGRHPRSSAGALGPGLSVCVCVCVCVYTHIHSLWSSSTIFCGRVVARVVCDVGFRAWGLGTHLGRGICVVAAYASNSCREVKGYVVGDEAQAHCDVYAC
jgi:hypothetical protein